MPGSDKNVKLQRVETILGTRSHTLRFYYLIIKYAPVSCEPGFLFIKNMQNRD